MSPHPARLTAYKALESAFSDAVGAFDSELWQVFEPDLRELLGRHQVLLAQMQSLQLALVREVQARGLHQGAQATSPAAFLSQLLTMSPGLAHEQVRLAESLTERHPEVGAALKAGVLSYEQARAIAQVLDGLPNATTPEQRALAEDILLQAAPGLNAAELKRLHKKLDEAIDPDGVEPRDEVVKRKRALLSGTITTARSG